MKVTVWLAWSTAPGGNPICDVQGTLEAALALVEREVREFHDPATDDPLRFELRNVECMESASGDNVDGLAVDTVFGEHGEQFASPWYLLPRTIEVEVEA